jgi:hypothetical protein
MSEEERKMPNEEEEDRNHPSSAVAVLAAVNVSGEKAICRMHL